MSFKWDNNKNSFKLKNISIQIKHGELIAIIGMVGSGKTSLIQALLKKLILIMKQLV